MIALLLRDVKLSVRAGGGALVGVLFFMTVVAVIPFGVGPDLNLLSRIGPAILWIGALLASLLGLDRLFQAEREDGSLDLLLMQETPLVLTVFVKCIAHWIATGLPLVVAAPLLGLFMNMDETAIGATTLTLLAGTPAITFIGAAGAAVAQDYQANRYHGPKDEYDPKWDFRGVQSDLDLYYRVGRALAESDAWPNWVKGDEFRAARDKSRAGAK